MNYKQARETLCNTHLEPNIAEAVGVVMDMADRLQRALALACWTLDDHFDCPFCFFPKNWAGWEECTKASCGRKGPECWQRYLRERSRLEQICRVCGYTDSSGGLSRTWVEDDLCSRCAEVNG